LKRLGGGIDEGREFKKVDDNEDEKWREVDS